MNTIKAISRIPDFTSFYFSVVWNPKKKKIWQLLEKLWLCCLTVIDYTNGAAVRGKNSDFKF